MQDEFIYMKLIFKLFDSITGLNKNYKFNSFIIISSDILVIIFSVFLSFWFRLSNNWSEFYLETAKWIVFFAIIYTILLNFIFNQYSGLTKYNSSKSIYGFIVLNLIIVVLLICTGVMFSYRMPPRSSWILLWLILSAITTFTRISMRDILYKWRLRNFYKIGANKSIYLKLFQESLDDNDIKIKKFEDNIGYKIEKEWFLDLVLVTQTSIKKSKLNYYHGRILYSLVSKYLSEQTTSGDRINILEVGTSRGFSALCMARAILDNKANGSIITIDYIPHEKKRYWNCLRDIDGPCSRSELLSKWQKEINLITFIEGFSQTILPKIGIERIHFAFLDGQHKKENVIQEYNLISKKQKVGDQIFFDDVSKDLFPGIFNALKLIENKNEYEIEYLNFNNERSYAIATKK